MERKLIDLTHTLSPEIPTWTLKCGFFSDVKLNYSDCTGPQKFKVQQLKMHAGIGTHMDAPSHGFEYYKNIDQLPIENFVAPGICINVSDKAIDEHFILSCDDILQFEGLHGPIPKHCIVIIYFGWDKYWNEPNKFVNNFQFPSIGKEAAELLLSRQIHAIGVDTMSPDLPSQNHPVHTLFLGSQKYLIENVANAKLLPPSGFELIALPIKTQGCTESPMRLIASLINQIKK